MQPQVEPLPTCRPGPARCRGAGATVYDLLPAVPGPVHDDAEIAAPDHVGTCGPCRAALIGCLRSGCAGPVPVMTAWLDQVRAAHFSREPFGLHEDAHQAAMLHAWVLLMTNAKFDPARTLADDGNPTGYLAISMRNAGLVLLTGKRRKLSSPTPGGSSGESPSRTRVVSLDEKLERDPSGSFLASSLAPHADDDPELAVLSAFGVRQIAAAIRTALEGFDQARRRVVELWLEGIREPSEALSQVEIGRLVGYSQGNVAKIIKAFVTELRAGLERQEDR